MADDALTTQQLPAGLAGAIAREQAVKARHDMLIRAQAAAATTTPADHALALDLAERKGVDPRAGMAAVRVDPKRAKLDLADVSKRPALADWLADPHNFSLAQDDIEALSAIDDAVGGHEQSKSMLSGISAGYHETELGLRVLGSITGVISDPDSAASMIEATARDADAAQRERPSGISGYGYDVLQGITGVLPALAIGGTAAEAGALIGGAGGSAVPVAGTLGGAAAGGIVGGAVGTYAGFGLTSAGSAAIRELSQWANLTDAASVRNALGNPMIRERVRQAAWQGGTASAGAMTALAALFPPGAAIAKAVSPGVSIGARVGLAAKEVGVQTGTMLGAGGAAELATGGTPDLSAGAVAHAAGQSLPFVLHGAVGHVMAARVEAAQAKADHASLSNAVEAAHGSAVRTLNQKRFERYAQAAADRGEVGTVYIDREGFDAVQAAAGKSPAAEAERLGGNYADALKTGTIEVPYGKALALLPDDPLAEQILEHATVRPGSKTLADVGRDEAAQEKAATEAAAAAEKETEGVEAAAAEQERADALEAELGLEPGSTRLFQSAASDDIRAAADAIDQAVEGQSAVGAADPASIPAPDTLRAAVTRDPAGTATKLRELADIREKQGPSGAARVRAEAIAAGRPAREAEAAARLHEAWSRMLVSAGVEQAEAEKAAVRIVRGEKAKPGSLTQTAYHGSPHTFEQFSLHKIGTGEGAQAFGWGLYFADKRAVAEAYRPDAGPILGWTVEPDKYGDDSSQVFNIASRAVAHYGDGAAAHLRAVAPEARGDTTAGVSHREVFASQLERAADALESGDISVRRGSGRLYTVDLAPAEDEYLLWDKPLAEQSEKVKAALAKAGIDIGVSKWASIQNNITGETIYRRLQNGPDGNNSPQAASKILAEAGIPGIKYLDAGSRAAKEGSYNYIIFDDKLVTITRMEQGERGAYLPASRVIELFEKADKTTLFHELGHHFVATTLDLAKRPEATERLKKLAADITEAAGGEITPESLEAISGAKFEHYLMTGEAPSPALKRVFAAIRQFFVSVYRTLKPESVSPELRSIFDRLLASDDEIAAAEAERGRMPTLTAEEAKAAGIPADVYEALSAKAAAAGEAMREKMTRKMVADLARETRAERAAALEQYRKEETARLDASPEGRAAAEVKLDREAVKALYDADTVKKLDQYFADGGLSPDVAAAKYGFDSVGDLLNGLIRVRDREAYIDSAARERLLREQPELYRNPEARREEARRIVAENAGDQYEIIQAEIRAFRAAELSEIAGVHKARAAEAARGAADTARALGKETRRADKAEAALSGEKARRAMSDEARREAFDRIPTREVAAEYAARRLRGAELATVKPWKFLQAARKARTTAAERGRAGDNLGAAEALGNELVNLELHRVATNIVKRAESAAKRLRKLQTPSMQEPLVRAGYADQMAALLERFSFRKGSPKRSEELSAFLGRLANEGSALPMTKDMQSVVSEAKRTHWSRLTIGELEGLRDLADGIYEIARNEDKTQAIERFQSIRAASAGVAEQVRASRPMRDSKKYGGEWHEDAQIIAADALAGGEVTSMTTRIMDGDESGGVVTSTIVRPINHGEDAYARTNRETHEAYDALWRKHFTPTVLKTMDSVRHNFAGVELSHRMRLNILSLAGREAGWQRLTDEFSTATLTEVFRTYTPEDVAFVKERWEFWNPSFKEAAGIKEKVTGRPIEDAPRRSFTVTTTDGKTETLEGGYHRIAYEDEAPLATMRDVWGFGGRAAGEPSAAARIEAGFLEPAVADLKGRKLRLDDGPMRQHINHITRFNALYLPIRDVEAVLRSPETSRSIQEHYGKATYKAMVNWINRVADGTRATESGLDRSLSYIRGGAVMSRLGFRVVSAMRQLYGLRLVAIHSGYRNAFEAMGQIIAHPVETYRQVQQMSSMMAERPKGTFYRELNETRQALPSKFRRVATQYAFEMLGRVQQATDMVAWIAEYRKAMSEAPEGAEPSAWSREAVARADQAVRDTQGSGQSVDLSGWTGGNATVRLLTTFGTDMSLKFNTTRAVWARANLRDPVQLARFMADITMIYVFPAAVTYMLATDDDDKLNKAGRRALSEAADTIPILRELSGPIQGYDYRGPAGLLFVGDAARAGQQIGQGEIDAALWRNTNQFGGDLLWYPASAINEAGELVGEVLGGRP